MLLVAVAAAASSGPARANFRGRSCRGKQTAQGRIHAAGASNEQRIEFNEWQVANRTGKRKRQMANSKQQTAEGGQQSSIEVL
jgi:hypothetical protein